MLLDRTILNCLSISSCFPLSWSIQILIWSCPNFMALFTHPWIKRRSLLTSIRHFPWLQGVFSFTFSFLCGSSFLLRNDDVFLLEIIFIFCHLQTVLDIFSDRFRPKVLGNGLIEVVHLRLLHYIVVFPFLWTAAICFRRPNLTCTSLICIT